jgi:hypothetical protein
VIPLLRRYFQGRRDRAAYRDHIAAYHAGWITRLHPDYTHQPAETSTPCLPPNSSTNSSPTSTNS